MKNDPRPGINAGATNAERHEWRWGISTSPSKSPTQFTGRVYVARGLHPLAGWRPNYE